MEEENEDIEQSKEELVNEVEELVNEVEEIVDEVKKIDGILIIIPKTGLNLPREEYGVGSNYVL